MAAMVDLCLFLVDIPSCFFDKDDRKRLWQKAFLVFWSGKALNDILANR
jgi:hypothetical protein